MDYKAEDGDNVLTVADGNISKIGYDLKQLAKPNPRTGQTIQGWGKYVVVDHPDGSQTLYAHLQEDSTSHLSEGQEITKGTILGKADTTGGATGPHLHLEYSPTGEIFDKSAKQDPLPCLCNLEDLPALTISGSDAPQDGSQYTATGGVEPYTWTISKGSITQTGVVTVSGQCGTATVTAADQCGNVVTKDVRMPGGWWKRIWEKGYCCEGTTSCEQWGYPSPGLLEQRVYAVDGNCSLSGYPGCPSSSLGCYGAQCSYEGGVYGSTCVEPINRTTENMTGQYTFGNPPYVWYCDTCSYINNVIIYEYTCP